MIKTILSGFVSLAFASMTAHADIVQVTKTSDTFRTAPDQESVYIANLSEGALLPEHVLQSSATRFPDILASIARERAANGDRLPYIQGSIFTLEV